MKTSNKQNKPFLCGGYTQDDWEVLMGAAVDFEFLDDYCVTPDKKSRYIAQATKPSWA